MSRTQCSQITTALCNLQIPTALHGISFRMSTNGNEKLKKSLDYKPSKVSAATNGNVPLRDTEFVWEFKRDITKAVEEDLSDYDSIRQDIFHCIYFVQSLETKS